MQDVTPFVKAKVEEKPLPKLKLVRLQLVPWYHLVDEDGTVIDEVQAAAVTMYPGKFVELKELVKQLEVEANKQTEQVKQLQNRPLW